MPVTPTAKLYKAFPPSFADDVTHHVHKRAEIYKAHGEIEKHAEKGANDSNSILFPKARPPASSRPIMSPLSETEYETSPRSDEPSPRTRLPTPSQGQCSESSARISRRKSGSRAGSRLAKSMIFVQSPRVARLPAQPTSVSLDDVDLWESDSEQNDNNSEKSGETLDNDIKTVLESKQDNQNETNANRLLRRPVKTSAKTVTQSQDITQKSSVESIKLKQSKHGKGREGSNREPAAIKNSKSPTPPKIVDNKPKRSFPLKNRVQLGVNTMVAPPEKSERKPVNHVSSSSRNEDIRRTYCIFPSKSFTEGKGLPMVTSRSFSSGDRRKSPSPVVMDTMEISPRDSKRSLRRVSRSPESMDSTEISPRSGRSSKETSPRVWKSGRAQKSPVPMETVDENSQDAKRKDLRSSNERKSTKSPMTVDGDSNDSFPTLPSENRQSAFTVPVLRSRKTPVPMETEETNTPETQSNTRRKVKFNSLVEVHDSESSTVDFLRNSSVNSAQLFKDLYLGKKSVVRLKLNINDDNDLMENIEDDSPRQL